MTNGSYGDVVVLLSGGADSAIVTALLSGSRDISGLWIDYGQAAADAESHASTRVADYFGIRLERVTLPTISPKSGGEIPHRNDLLIATAAALFPRTSLAIGIHAGTGYPDCSPSWAKGWKQLLDLQFGGEAELLTPLLGLEKHEVYSLAADLEVPLDITHSCEAGNSPCGACRSCADRRMIDARA